MAMTTVMMNEYTASATVIGKRSPIASSTGNWELMDRPKSNLSTP